MIKSFNRISVAAAFAAATAAALSLGSGAAHAQVVVSDTLTGGHSLLNWTALDGACLTAGDNTVTPNDPTQPLNYTPAAPGALTIQKCSGFSYYTSRNSTLVGGQNGTMPDTPGNGALRLTNGDKRSGGSNGDNQTGAVISNFTFPTNQGIQVTWTSVSYGGDNNQNTGADGISFFLSDGAKSPNTAGGLGGSLGYSCSNVNSKYEGLVGGYIGVGIDEFGNFVNSGDNTSTGATGGAKPGAIGVRGAGNITWLQLQAAYPTYYPTTVTDLATQKAAVIATCKNGKVYDTTNSSSTSTALLDYKLLNYAVLPSTGASAVKLANQQATSSNTDNVPTRALANFISYSLRITSAGLLDFSYTVGSGTGSGSPTSVLTSFDIKAANGGYVPASFRFGFSAGTGGGNNVHEITCFKAAPADTSNSTAGSNVQQSAQVVNGTQVFLAYYHPVNSWGQLSASNLVYTAASGSTPESLTTATSANWDASCVLTGGICNAISTTSTITAQASRVVLSNDGAASGGNGVAFTASGLTSTQLTALGDSTTSAPVIAYLRGDRTNEVGSGTGAYRIRSGVLGDIVDSSPVWVGYPNSSYSGPWADKLKASATFSEGTSYATFKTNNATRMNVVYVGSNDGMLHGFQAGAFAAPVGSAAPVFDTTNNNGKEVLAYVPAQVVSTIHSSTASLDFTSPSYNHNFFVDATPGTGDLYYSGNWHTWLVGGLGPGAHAAGAVNTNTATITAPVSSIYALDVTDPSATNFKEANAGTLVVGEWSSSTLKCGTVSCGVYLGQTLGTPLIRRLHDGTWGVIFGNGTNSNGTGTSDTGHSGLFILHVDPSNGNKTFQYIDAGSTAGGGIVQVASVDLDGDHIADYVYAGDVLGNLYRFDLTDTTSSSNWSVMKIFQTASGQPISTAPVVASIPSSGTGSNPKVIVMFGTGQKQPITATDSEKFATGGQALYGIWDANMVNWNATSTDTKYAAVGTSTSTTTAISVTSSQLQTQTATADSTNSTRTATNASMCWQGMTGCSGTGITSNAMGWTMALPTSTEQVIYNPLVANGILFVNSTIPATSTALTCQSTDVAGWTMGISVTNGGAGSVPAFDGGYSGYSLNGAGTPAIYAVGSSTFLGTNTNDHHQFKAKKTNPQPGNGKRLTWTKIR